MSRKKTHDEYVVEVSQVNTNIEINNNFTVTNNTPFDQDRQDNNISQLMAKELRRFGKITRK